MQFFSLTQWFQIFLFLTLLFDPALAESEGGIIFEGSQKTIILSKGQYELYPRGASRIIHNASGQLLKVTDEGRNLRLLGKSFGETHLSIGSESVRIVITSSQQKIGGQAMWDYLFKRPGLAFRAEHPCHQISGELLRWSDWLRLHEIAISSQTCFRFNAKIAPEIRESVHHQIIAEFQGSSWGLPSFKDEGPVTLSFPEAAKKQSQSLEKELKWWGLSPDFSSEPIDIKPMIRVKIIVAEVNQNLGRVMGISWPGTYQAQLVPKAAIEKDWEIQLHALESQGQGKVLASPSLLSRSGEPAEFFAGGEIPFQVTTRKSHQLVWKKYGISMKIIPHTDHRGYLKVELTAEISTPDSSFSSNGMPALKTHRVNSHFNLRQPRTITISGLFKDEQSKSRGGLPLLSQIPILGTLFSSRQFLENHSELVILVTPSLVNELDETSSLPKGISSDELDHR